jgi:hypothetical protein
MLCKAIFLSNYEQLCAGDLGTNTEHLEHNLVEITSLAHKWGAIILIDEADVTVMCVWRNVRSKTFNVTA